MNTPKTHVISLAAGAEKRVPVKGHFFVAVALTGPSSVDFAFDTDAYQTVHLNLVQRDPDGFELIRFRNSSGTAATLTFVASRGQLSDTQNTALAAMSTALTSIDADCDNLATIAQLRAGGSTLTQKAPTTVNATGSAGTLVFAANASRFEVLVQADKDNTGYIYLGNDDTVDDTDHFAQLIALGTFFSKHYKGPIYAVGSAASQKVLGWEC